MRLLDLVSDSFVLGIRSQRHRIYTDRHRNIINNFQNPVTRLHKRKWCRDKTAPLQAVALSEADAKRALAYFASLFDPVYYHICLWQLTSHRQRIGEVLSLEWSDVDWDQEIAWITGTMQWVDENGRTTRNAKQYHTKEGRPRIPVFFGGGNQHLKQSLLALERLRHHSRWVFADTRGMVPTLSHLRNVYGKSGLFNEKYLKTHKCRKTALTLATINCGTDLAKRLGGHATDSAHVRYIDRYLKEVNNPVPAKLAEILNLNSVASRVESRNKKTSESI